MIRSLGNLINLLGNLINKVTGCKGWFGCLRDRTVVWTSLAPTKFQDRSGGVGCRVIIHLRQLLGSGGCMDYCTLCHRK